MGNPSAGSLLEQAIKLHRGGDLDEARRLFRSVLEAQPDQPDALRYLGLASLQAGAYTEAAKSFQHTVDLGVGGADVHDFLGSALLALGQVEKALVAFRSALELQPDLARAWNGMGLAHEKLGDHEEAARSFQRAVALDDAYADAANNLGNAMQILRRNEEALSAYRKAASLVPRSAKVSSNIGDMLKLLGDLPASVVSYQRALANESDNVLIRYRLAAAQFQQGRSSDALDSVNRCLMHDERSQLALSLKWAILHDLHRADEAGELVDYERFVKVMTLSPPEPYESVAAFHDEFEDYIRKHDSLEWNPFGASTRGGLHSANLLANPEGPVLVLESMLRRAVEDFRDELPTEPRHPFLGHKTKQTRLVMQANILDEGGYLDSHVHPAAWLSGAYYVRVPAVEGDDAHGGSIEFGALPEEFRRKIDLPTHRVRPVEGTLVLFPSYFFHGTVPFESNTSRISVGVDVLAD